MPSKNDDQNDTPPPYRSKSDHEIRLPIDPEWFHEFRKETKKGITEVRRDVNTLESRLNEARIANIKHDEQISQLATDMATTDRDVSTINTRVVYLEKSEDKRSNAEIQAEKRASERASEMEKSLWTKSKEAVVIAFAVGIAGGLGGFIWFMFVVWIKTVNPGVKITP